MEAIRAFYYARPFVPFLINTDSGDRFPIRRPDSIAIPPEANFLILASQRDGFDQIEIANIADIREIAQDDPEAIEPASPAEAAVEDREAIRELRGRIDGMEADIHRGDLDHRREVQRIDLDHRREVQRIDLDHTGELALLKLRSNSQGWLLGLLFVVLIGGLGPFLYRTVTINAQEWNWTAGLTGSRPTSRGGKTPSTSGLANSRPPSDRSATG